jgi:hypothetical protein
MLTAIVLSALAISFRVFSSTFHGSRLPRRWAWVVPIAAMAISDYFLDHNRSRPLFELTRWTIYATFAATTLIGPLANLPRFGRWLLPFLSLGGSIVFFLTSNLATWAEGQLYPMTLSGLMLCYTQAIPFFGNTVAADLLGTALLFGLAPLFERIAHRASSPELIPGTAEVHASDSSVPT